MWKILNYLPFAVIKNQGNIRNEGEINAVLHLRPRKGLNSSDAKVGRIGGDLLPDPVSERISRERGMKKSGFPNRGPRIDDGDFLGSACGGIPGNIKRKASEPHIFDGECLIIAMIGYFVCDQAVSPVCHPHIASRNGEIAAVEVANLVSFDEGGAVGEAGVAGKDRDIGIGIDVGRQGGEFGVRDRVFLRMCRKQQCQTAQYFETTNHVRSKISQRRSSKPLREASALFAFTTMKGRVASSYSCCYRLWN